jgi:hypothetical protein
MASGKKKRKSARQARKQRLPRNVPFRHPDGDRRHRETMAKAVREALALKKLMQQGGPLPPDEEE